MKARMIRFGFPVVLSILYCLSTFSLVSAHALLVRSIPEANASLPSSPAKVELFFSEAVAGSLSSIKVLDSSSQIVDLGDVQVDPADPTHMTVSLRSLTDGVYTVSWKAISAADGHLTTGSFPFAVGNVEAPVRTAANTEKNLASLSGSGLIAKWLFLISLAILVGRRSFTVLIWLPSRRQSNLDPSLLNEEPAEWNLITWICLIGLFIALGLGLLSQAGQAAGSELAFPWVPEMARLLTATQLGSILLVRIFLAMIAMWLVISRDAGWKRWGVFSVGLGLLITESVMSHAASEPHPVLPVLNDWLHLIAMSFWIGGLVFFVSGMRAIRQLDAGPRTALTSQLIVHFSALALSSVGLLGLTGLYSAVLRIGTIPALFNTVYGQALLLKIGLIAPLVGLGAINLLIISPRLRRDRLNGASNLPVVLRFRKVILGEIILASIVLFSASLLSSLPPPQVTATTNDLTSMAMVDDLHVELEITPGHIGVNTFSVRLTSGDQPVTSVKEIQLRFTSSQSDLPPSDAQLIGQGDGTYRTKGAYLSLPGAWQVQVITRRENKFDAYANFNFTVRNPAASQLLLATPQVAGALVVAIGLILGILFVSLKGQSAWRTVFGGMLAGILLGQGLLLTLSQPAPVKTVIANPIPPNPQSISVGKALYEKNCVVCHGETGKGDGPAGLAMNPPPADLTIHAVPGVHTDAQLFLWIQDGFPNSRMPPFKSSLSDIDRWNLVNFIRTLAPK